MTNEELAELIRKLDAKVDGVENRLGNRIGRLEKKVDNVAINFDRKLGQLEEKIGKKIDDVAAAVRVLNREVHGDTAGDIERTH